MKWYYLLLIALLSCNDDVRKQAVQPRKAAFDTYYRDSILKAFSLPYALHVPTDSNSMFFYELASFDTSFILHVRKEGDVANVVCYTVLPSYHRNVADYYDKENRLLYFEGGSFRIDTGAWRRIIIKTDSALSLRRSEYSACYDCPQYFVSFNSKEISSYVADRRSLGKLATFLKDSLLYEFRRDRKPKVRY